MRDSRDLASERSQDLVVIGKPPNVEGGGKHKGSTRENDSHAVFPAYSAAYAASIKISRSESRETSVAILFGGLSLAAVASAVLFAVGCGAGVSGTGVSFAQGHSRMCA